MDSVNANKCFYYFSKVCGNEDLSCKKGCHNYVVTL